MNQLSKRLIAIVLVLIVCVHFTMILLYCTSKIENEKLKFVNNLYIYPVFHQNWNLFVPAPNAERKLFVRYKTDNSFNDWQDILGREITNHKRNRLLGNEARVLLLSNSLIIELNSIDHFDSRVFDSEPKNKEFEVLQFEIEKYLRLEFKLNGTLNYEILLVSSTNNKTKAYYMPSLIAS
jgi:hypothetical protein